MTDRLTTLKTVLWALVGVLASVTVIRFMYGLGAVTDLSDAAPWGLWIGFDVMSGVALAAGGFVLAGIVYIFGLERYRPFVRAAILTALLGYAAVAVGLLYDLGLPWRIWHPMVNWQYHSVLFEVAMCVMLYLTVLFLEFLPVILEHRFFQGRVFQNVMKGLKRISILLVIAGIVLSTLHQSSLGSLFLITPFRLHPLWYSPIIYVLFFISAVGLGLMTVVLESLFSNYFLGHKIHTREISGLGLAAGIVLWVYLALRLGDLAMRGLLGMAFEGTWQSNLFLFEIGVSALIPATLMMFKRIRSHIAGVGVAAAMVVGGMILHRIDVSIIAFARPEGVSYFPTWEEFAVSIGIVAGGILIFLFFVENLRVFEDVEGHPPEPEREPAATTLHPLLPKPLALPKNYSIAFVLGAVLALPFLPLGGVDPVPVPTQEPRSVEAVILDPGLSQPRILGLARAEEGLPEEIRAVFSGEMEASLESGDLPAEMTLDTTRVLMLDGDRDGDLVLFDHDDHAERLGGEQSCATCHHLNHPLDQNTSCFECHSDMFDGRSVFDHDVHVAELGDSDSCIQCHTGESEVKSYETTTTCNECHQSEIQRKAFVDPPPEHWGDAVGYMDAMHGLCVECHEVKAAQTAGPGPNPEGLDRCMTCHDVDWREDVEKMEPGRQVDVDNDDRMAGSSSSRTPGQ
jgi:Ni/Fe-hydrogenase subunit HybB-like protein